MVKIISSTTEMCKTERRNMILSVTRKHIKEAGEFIPWYCPIALALRDAGFYLPLVWEDEIEASGRKFRVTKRMAAFIGKFDCGEKVKPARFLLSEF